MPRTVLLICFFLLSRALCSQTVTILIDPGHGGTDPGHESVNRDHLAEKDLNLIIARKFGAYLQEKLSNVVVLYTRTDDTYPTLDDRVNMANEKNVDYFISVHCNGSPNTGIHGTESHVHSMSSRKSVKLAQEFEKEFGGKAGRRSRGVKDSDDREHTLQVLKFTEMTSVLVECGFLTNVREANYLNTTYGQEILASALFRAMRSFLKAEHPAISFTGSGKPSGSTVATGQKTGGPYTVQIMSSKEELETTLPAFKKLDKPVVREQISETGYRYRYVTGSFTTKEAAESYKNEVRKKGFPDAIVIPKKKT
jgi:N-acetylmuramoyl-L-alanine amidase